MAAGGQAVGEQAVACTTWSYVKLPRVSRPQFFLGGRESPALQSNGSGAFSIPSFAEQRRPVTTKVSGWRVYQAHWCRGVPFFRLNTAHEPATCDRSRVRPFGGVIRDCVIYSLAQQGDRVLLASPVDLSFRCQRADQDRVRHQILSGTSGVGTKKTAQPSTVKALRRLSPGGPRGKISYWAPFWRLSSLAAVPPSSTWHWGCGCRKHSIPGERSELA